LSRLGAEELDRFVQDRHTFRFGNVPTDVPSER
jgi:hypothetical protein